MWSQMRDWVNKRSPAQVITGYYLGAVIVSILLFSIPAVRKPGVTVTFFDTVFTAVSIVSDTGLGVFNVAETYSVFGYFVIILVLQFGGIGIMAMSTFFWLLFGRKIGLRERRLIMVDNNQFAISGSPNSVGGGIRTTTFALNILFIYHFAKGNRSIRVFNRELHPDDILKSLAISLLAIVLCCLSVISICITDRQHPLIAIVLEVCSAFGTVGLSTGITPDLSIIAQCILMILMFLGRIGLTTCLYFIGGGLNDAKFHYPVERVMTG
ncbi:potassium transporter TrkG [Paenibacillus sp. MCAF20]